jgi:hypothetical protein
MQIKLFPAIKAIKLGNCNFFNFIITKFNLLILFILLKDVVNLAIKKFYDYYTSKMSKIVFNALLQFIGIKTYSTN